MILAVDDDVQVLRSIRRVLEEAGYEVITASSGEEALALVAQQRPDLVLLDMIMPEMDGLEVCRRLRSDPFLGRLPIIFLTAKGRPGDVATGLDSGADDYLIKPFEVVELPARVRALLRRAAGGALDVEADEIRTSQMTLAIHQLAVQVEGEWIELTPMEHRFLYNLMSHAGQPISIEQLLREVWEYPPGVGDPKLVRVHVVNLRNKIEPDPDDPQLILNIRGRGYMVNV